MDSDVAANLFSVIHIILGATLTLVLAWDAMGNIFGLDGTGLTDPEAAALIVLSVIRAQLIAIPVAFLVGLTLACLAA